MSKEIGNRYCIYARVSTEEQAERDDPVVEEAPGGIA